MASEPYPIRPYPAWAQEEHQHWIDAGHTFGAHLMEKVRDRALKQIPAGAPDEVRQAAEQGIDNTLWNLMALLDGTVGCPVGDTHSAEYVLSQRIVDANGLVIETIELAPDGDGLLIGYAGWRKGDFGQERWKSESDGHPIR